MITSGIGYAYVQKILKIKIPFQILFYPFRCMFKIMKGYKIFAFTPSGKSLKKTLLHIEGALYAQKSVPSWFLAVFDSKTDVCWNLKKLSILWYTKFQLITVKYHEVKALFCKMSRHVEKLGSVHTKCQLIPGCSFGYRSCVRDRDHFTTLKWLV